MSATMASTDSSQPTCQNCTTSTTPLWRRDEIGSVLCNACGLFLKLHGRARPISLKTDVIKSRNRVKTSGQGQSQKKKASIISSLQFFTADQNIYYRVFSTTITVSATRDRKLALLHQGPSIIVAHHRSLKMAIPKAQTPLYRALQPHRCMAITRTHFQLTTPTV
jgi:hypothetical protein